MLRGWGVEEAVSLCRGEGEKICMFWGWLLCCVIGRMHAFAASSISTKRMRSGLLLGPVRWLHYAAGADKEALKKGLTRFDVTMKLQVKAIE